MMSLPAASVSRSIRQSLNSTPLLLTTLAVFDNACDLAAADGRVIALVSPTVGDGPLNIVASADLPRPLLPPAGTPAMIDCHHLSVGKIEIGLACPDWDPRPNWAGLRTHYTAVRAAIPALLSLALRLAPSLGLLALYEPDRHSPSCASRVLDAVRQAQAGLPGNEMWTPGQFEMVAARLAGLGWGLTPCGDDWLAGLLTWAWLANPRPQDVGAAVIRIASGRTSMLSAAFLRSAAQGECDATWQNLLTMLAAGRLPGLDDAVRGVLARGATSGADRLAGFLFAAGCTTN